MSCLKVLKLLLVSQAFSFIISVSHEIKQNTAAINSDRHRQACQVQDAINTILPSVEQKLRSFATNIAKNLPPKVMMMPSCCKLTHLTHIARMCMLSKLCRRGCVHLNEAVYWVVVVVTLWEGFVLCR